MPSISGDRLYPRDSSKFYMGVDRTILQSKEIFIFDIFEAPQDGH
jgi:hypothetical protein